MMKRKYIYLSSRNYDETVFITQIVDWLKIYRLNDIDFSYIHLVYYTLLWKKKEYRKQIKSIEGILPEFTGYTFCFPSRGLFVYINAILWHFKLKKYYRNYDEILIFSRNMFGKEIEVLKKIASVPIIFYYDARAASCEENRYNAAKSGDFSFSKFRTFSHIFYTEYKTVNVANRVFSVSGILKKYFQNNYSISADKVFVYPCLSDASKFYMDNQLRIETRNELGFTDMNQVYLYSGGLAYEHHISKSIFEFFNFIASQNSNVRFLLLSKDSVAIETKLKLYPQLANKLIYLSVPNAEIVKYLNAADYGLLLRDNVIMNNVASPTKFAEYMLCGLPTIISVGVGDYTEFCMKEHVGIVVTEDEMNNWNLFDFKKITESNFDRKRIAAIGLESFSKQSRVNQIIGEFKKNYN